MDTIITLDLLPGDLVFIIIPGQAGAIVLGLAMAGSALVGTPTPVDGGGPVATGMDIDMDMVTGIDMDITMDITQGEGLVMWPDIVPVRDNLHIAISIETGKMEYGKQVSDRQLVLQVLEEEPHQMPVQRQDRLIRQPDHQHGLSIRQLIIAQQQGRQLLQQVTGLLPNLLHQVPGRTMSIPIEMEMFIEETILVIGSNAVMANGIMRVHVKAIPVI